MFFRVIGPVSNTEVQSDRTTYFVDKQCGRNHVPWPTPNTNCEAGVGTHCNVRRPFVKHFWIPVRCAQCDWTQTLCYLTVVANYLCSARWICESQHKFDVQQTICLLHVTLICDPKENISSAFLKHGEKYWTFIALRSTIMCEPGILEYWNIDGRSVCSFLFCFCSLPFCFLPFCLCIFSFILSA